MLARASAGQHAQRGEAVENAGEGVGQPCVPQERAAPGRASRGCARCARAPRRARACRCSSGTRSSDEKVAARQRARTSTTGPVDWQRVGELRTEIAARLGRADDLVADRFDDARSDSVYRSRRARCAWHARGAAAAGTVRAEHVDEKRAPLADQRQIDVARLQELPGADAHVADDAVGGRAHRALGQARRRQLALRAQRRQRLARGLIVGIAQDAQKLELELVLSRSSSALSWRARRSAPVAAPRHALPGPHVDARRRCRPRTRSHRLALRRASTPAPTRTR